MTCNPLIVHRDGRYQAWCKPCAWDSEWYDAVSWARAAAERHRGTA